VSFDGEWDQNQCKSGVMLYTSGDSYNGHLQAGEYHGQGVYSQYNDDITYSGSWSEGTRSSVGQITFGKHGIFTDLFDNDKAVGSAEAKYVNVTTGMISIGDAALQLTRDHGAEQFVQRARKQTRRLVDDMNAAAAAKVAAATAAKRAKRAKQQKQKTASAAATARDILAEHATSDTQDAECDANSVDGAESVGSQSDADDQCGDSSDDENNAVANADTTTTATTASTDAQSCVYAYTLPTHTAINSDGQAFYIIGSHNTVDIIEHLEQTVDIASTGGYTVKLVIPCAQGTQQQLEKAIRNKLIASNVRPNSDGAFLTSLSQLALLHIICLGGQVNM
jgi:hypothetical protein